MKGLFVEHPRWGRGRVKHVWPRSIGNARHVYVYTKHVVWQNPNGEYGYYAAAREVTVLDAVTLLGELAT